MTCMKTYSESLNKATNEFESDLDYFFFSFSMTMLGSQNI